MATTYEIGWQVFGSRTVTADTDEAAFAAVTEWLEDEHGLTSQTVAGWDYNIQSIRVSA